jgi:ELWxxDGT repeat protein
MVNLPELSLMGYASYETLPLKNARQLTRAAGKLFFVADYFEYGAELWALDDPELPPFLVRDIAPTIPVAPPNAD